MSRVEDSDASRRAEEARLAEKKAQQKLQTRRQAEATAFDQALARKTDERSSTDAAFGQRMREARGGAARQEAQRAASAKAPPPGADAAASQVKAEEVLASLLGDQQAGDARQAARHGMARSQLAMSQREGAADAQRGTKLAEAKEKAFREDEQTSSSQQSQSSAGASKGAAAKKARHDAAEDSGSGGKGSDGGKQDQQPQPFRLPPAALMPPPQIAKPRDGDAGSRLRGITQEIVDKIVSRVLVGHNSQGVAEFRLDLKSSVLKGLSIKVSGGRGGKIKAVFSGSDAEVLAALKRGSRELTDALAARGLTLEELLFEEAANR